MKALFSSFLILITMQSYSQDMKKWFPEGGQYYSTKLLIKEEQYKYLFVFYEDGKVYVDFALSPERPNESAKTDKIITFNTSEVVLGDVSGRMKIEDDFKDYEYKFVVRNQLKIFAFKDVFGKEWNYFIWDKY